MPRTYQRPFFETTVHAIPTTTFFVLRGELDTASAPALTEAVREELSSGAASMVFDLSELDFADVAGARALAQAVAATKQSGRRAVAVCPRRGVERVLRLLGYTEELGLSTNEPAPMRALAIATA